MVSKLMARRRQTGNALIWCVFLLAIASLECRAQDLRDLLESMEDAEANYQEQISQELVAFMSLETMFPDARVRELAKAAGKGNTAKVERLVAEGVDVNSKGTQNATPLFWAMSNKNGFEKLLELGADPNVVFGDGGTVMHWAASAKDSDLLKAALQHGGDPNLKAGSFMHTPLFEAIGVNKDSLELLLDAGADINARSMWGSTPVHTAASLGQYDVVYLLLSRGADYTIEDDNGLALSDIIENMRDALIPGHEQEQWMHRVIEWLEQKRKEKV